MGRHSKKIADKIVSGFDELSNSLKNRDDVVKKFTCRKIVLDLNPIPYSPDDVKQARELLNASQALFAQFIGVATSCVQSWEQGRSTPSDVACRFMDEIRIAPDYWRQRFNKAIVVKDKDEFVA